MTENMKTMTENIEYKPGSKCTIKRNISEARLMGLCSFTISGDVGVILGG